MKAIYIASREESECGQARKVMQFFVYFLVFENAYLDGHRCLGVYSESSVLYLLCNGHHFLVYFVNCWVKFFSDVTTG